MLVTRKSNITGIEHTMDLPVTSEQVAQLESGSGYVQSIFPCLNADQREFLLTGITPEEWDEFVGEEPEE